MSTFSAQPAERSKKRSKAISVLGVVTLLCLAAGCNGPGSDTQVGKIETPSAIQHFLIRPPYQPDNLALWIGAVRQSGETFPLLLGPPLPPAYQIQTAGTDDPDLRGAVQAIELHSQWGHGPFGDQFFDGVQYASVLEFTFPETPPGKTTEINWFVKPNLLCSYELEQVPPAPSPPSFEGPGLHCEMYNACIWAEYVVFQDPHGMWDLLEHPSLIWDTLSNFIEDEREYIITCEPDSAGTCSVSGTLMATDDERSGTMVLAGGFKPKLFVGVYFNLYVEDKGERAQIGGATLPADVSGFDRCTFDFGTNSYYTMRPRDNE